MRVAPEELQAVHRAGALTRYAVFGPVAFVIVDLPDTGIAGTGLDEPCLTEHHGIVTRGSVTVHHDDGRTERFEAGTAFYVPPGPPTHTFSSSARSVVCGFAPVPDEAPPPETTLAEYGFEPVARPRPPVPPPSTVVLGGQVQPFRRPGAIDVEGSVMGPWLFMTARFGPRSGYTSGWCDLPHWGLVLDGEIVITFEGTTELASAGDAYYAPPGHRFASADGATVADYTPIDAAQAERVSRWRRAVLDVALGAAASDTAAPVDELDVEAAGFRPGQLHTRAASPGL